MIRLLFLSLTLYLFASPISAYTINKNTGLVEDIPFHEAPYPNREERPNENDISLLVIHSTEIVARPNLPYTESVVHYLFTQQYEVIRKTYGEEK